MRKFLLVIILTFIMLVSTLPVKAVRYNVPVSVTINPIYRLELEIEAMEKFIQPGENLSVLVELEKEDLRDWDNSRKIKVRLNYEILRGHKVLTNGSADSIKVIEEAEKIIEIPVSVKKPGRYILKITAGHPQAYGGEDKDSFIIRPKGCWRKWGRWYEFKLVLFGNIGWLL